MDFTTTLLSLLTTGAGLAATEAVKALGKSTFTDAYEAVKSRLIGDLGAKSVALVEDVAENPAYAAAIKTDLAKPEVINDGELRRLAQVLEAAMEALPDTAKTAYAVQIREIHAGRHLLFENVEGVQADIVTSKGDMTFKNTTTPGKH